MTEEEKTLLINEIVDYLISHSQSVEGIPIQENLDGVSSFPAIKEILNEESQVVRVSLDSILPEFRYYNGYVQYRFSSGNWINLFQVSTSLDGYATKDYVDLKVSEVISNAPVTLNTLNKIAAALNYDPSFYQNIYQAINTKWTTNPVKIANWDQAFIDRHVHDNISSLNLITDILVGKWNEAYSWGDHSVAGYEYGLGNPLSNGQILSSNTDGTRSWVDQYIHHQSTAVPGIYTKVTVDLNGHVTYGNGLSQTDIPSISWNQVPFDRPTTLLGYGITDAYTKNYIDKYLQRKYSGVVDISEILLNENTVTVPASKVNLYSNSKFEGYVSEYEIAEKTFTITGIDVKYIVVSYNNGSPEYIITQERSMINYSNVIPIITLIYDGVKIHSVNWDEQANGLSERLLKRINRTQRFQRDGGLIVNVDGSRTITISQSTIYFGASEVVYPSSSSSTNLIYQYHHSDGTWTYTRSQFLNNLEYDNGTNLVSLSNDNRYALNWIYAGVGDDGDIITVLGTGDYKLDEALNAQPPLILPDVIRFHGILVGKVIYQKGLNTPYQVISISEQSISAGGTVVEHNNLNGLQGGNLEEFYHLSHSEYLNAQDSLSFSSTPGTYRSVTTDSKGRIVSGTNPTTLSEYGISDEDVTNSLLTGYALGQNAEVSSTDSIIGSIGKLQAYINARQGTVTSVGVSVPLGFTVLNSPITTNGIIGLGYAEGYSLPSNSIQSNWSSAYAYSLIGHLPLTGGNLSGNLGITGDLNISGNIYQSGSVYETHAENIYSKNDYIYMRDGSSAGLLDGYYSGLEFVKYDGVNNGRLAIDSYGVARVGDVGDEQPLATREESPLSNGYAYWDGLNKRFGTKLIPFFEIVNKPTTLTGYGITDGQPLDADLSAIASLSETSGLLRKTSVNTWMLDTNIYLTAITKAQVEAVLTGDIATHTHNQYLTGNQTITVSGDATGSGTTAIALTLANSGVTSGTYNDSATQVRPFTVDSKGRIINIGNAVTITPDWINITSKPTTLAGYGITDALLKSDINIQVGGTKNSQMLWTSWNNSDVYGGAIQIREYGYVDDSQSDWYYSPAVTFHWGNRAVKRFGMRYDGQLAIDNNPILWSGNYSSYALPLSGGLMAGVIGMNNYSLVLGSSLTDNQPDGSPWYGLRHIGGGNVVKLSGYFGISLTTGFNELIIPTGGNPTINGDTIWHSGNFTNLNQITTRNFSDLQNKPTTIDGYQITDGVKNNGGLWNISIKGRDNTVGNALLQSGSGRSDDESGSTWLFWDTGGGSVNPWGIRHNQAGNYIEYYGNGLVKTYIDLNNGYIYTNSKANTGDQDLSNLSTYTYVDNTFLKKSGGTMTGHLGVSSAGKVASFGINSNDPSAAIANQNTFIQLVTSGAANSMGLIFHNVGISTSALEYVHTNFSNGYFNFKSDTASWGLKVNGNTVWHSANDGSGSGLDADLWRGYTPDNINVASATRLQTGRYIFGQYFDGTSDLNGDCIINHSAPDAGIKINNDSNTYSRIRFYDTSGNFATIHAFSEGGYLYNGEKSINLDTAAISLGHWNDPVLYVKTAAKNVGINTTNPAYNLDVNGTLRVTNTSTFNNAITLNGSSLTVISPDAIGGWARGMHFSNYSAPSTTVGGVGFTGYGSVTDRVYIGMSSEPWGYGSLRIKSNRADLDLSLYLNNDLYVGSGSNPKTIAVRNIQGHGATELSLNPWGGSVSIGTADVYIRLNGSVEFYKPTYAYSIINAFKNTPVGTAYNELGIQVYSGDGSPVGIGFHRGGYTQTILEHSGDGLAIRNSGAIGTGSYGNLAVNAVTASNYYLSLTNQIRTNAGYLELVSAGNEICMGGVDGTMHVNYRPAGNGTPTTWRWLAGSPTTLADFYLGSLVASGTVTAPTFVGNLNGNASTATKVYAETNGTNSIELARASMADNDFFRILVGGTASNAGYAEIATADDGTEPIYVRQYSGPFSSLLRTATLLDEAGNTGFPGTVTANRFYAGYDAGVANSMSCSAWFRSSNATGWYNETYNGGIYMEDINYVRIYANKAFKVTSTASDSINTDGGIEASGPITTDSSFINTSYPSNALLLAGGGAMAQSALPFKAGTLINAGTIYLTNPSPSASTGLVLNSFAITPLESQDWIDYDITFNVNSGYSSFDETALKDGKYVISITSLATGPSSYMPAVPNISYINTNNFTVTAYYNGPYIVNILYRV